MKGMLWAMLAAGIVTLAGSSAQAAGEGQPTDWNRFYNYPYVYYPHNFTPPQQYNNLYYRYPVERQIPVYNKDWYNFYPTAKPYHKGAHFMMDTF